MLGVLDELPEGQQPARHILRHVFESVVKCKKLDHAQAAGSARTEQPQEPYRAEEKADFLDML